MTTYNDNAIDQVVINRLNQTQFNNASALEPNEIYAVDPQFTGGKVLISTADGDITESNISSTGVVTDVQVNSTSIILSGVANIPIASTTDFGVVKVYNNKAYGLGFGGTGVLQVASASDAELLAKSQAYKPVVPSNLDYAVKVGITTNTNTLTSSEQTTACAWLGAGKEVIFRDWD